MKHCPRYCSALILAGTVMGRGTALAHEESTPFSGSILDPVILHHAHIENEQRLNFFFLNVRWPAGGKLTTYSPFKLATI